MATQERAGAEQGGVAVELAGDRKIRHRNKVYYRFNHWPIWIFVFFILPGPLTLDLFDRGFDRRMAVWLGAVLLGTGIAGLRGRLPGCEPRPYIIRFTEDRPNPLYRRVCYTCAWSAVVSFGVLNLAGLVTAVVTGVWSVRQMYDTAYFPVAGAVWVLGAAGRLPRVKRSTKGEGHERPVLLRVGVGDVHRAAGSVGSVARPAGRPGGGRREALRLRGHSGLGGMAVLSGEAAADAADRAG